MTERVKPGPKGPRLKPKELKKRKQVILSPEVFSWLSKRKNQSKCVELALIKTYKIG